MPPMIAPQICGFIRKPFQLDDLIETLPECGADDGGHQPNTSSRLLKNTVRKRGEDKLKHVPMGHALYAERCAPLLDQWNGCCQLYAHRGSDFVLDLDVTCHLHGGSAADFGRGCIDQLRLGVIDREILVQQLLRLFICHRPLVVGVGVRQDRRGEPFVNLLSFW